MLERPNRSLTTRARAGRWPWLIVAIGAAALKVDAYASLARHPGELVFLLAAGLAFSLLRPKPVLIAAMAGALFALVLAPHPVGLGIAVGVGAFVLLTVLFFAIATILRARQG